jgi:hypothetical protein
MQNVNLCLLHTIMCRRRLRRKKQNMAVHPIKMKRLEFGIFSQSPMQLVPKRWLCISVSIFTTRSIVDSLAVLI